MKHAKDLCTCKDTGCRFHPANHDAGCTPCIEKNLKKGEIPSCFFNAVGACGDKKSFFYEDFARLVLEKNPAGKETISSEPAQKP